MRDSGVLQLVRGVGKQQLVRAHQVLDARGRAVEALREARHLVLALDLDARLEIAGTQLIDACLQSFQPAGEAAHQGIGAHRHGERDGAQEGDEPQNRVPRPPRRARHQPALVGQPDGPGRAPAPEGPSAGLAAWARQLTPDGGDAAQTAVEQRQIDLEAAMDALERLLLGCVVHLGRGQVRGHQLAQQLGPLLARREAPEQAAEQHHEQQAGDDRQVELLVEMAHRPNGPVLSPAPWRTHSRCRAP